MRRFILFTLFLSTFLLKGQPTCSSTGTVGDIFYPNTVSTPTTPPTNATQFLCGPNTVVYDTVPIGCLFVFVNTGSTLYFNKGCPQTIVANIWLKNNSTLNILAGCPPGLKVFYEPLAVINNTAAIPIGSVACTSITFPAINCATGIEESENEKKISVYPLPTSNILNISSEQNNFQNSKIEIINYLGQTVLKTEFKNQIDVSELASGFYTLLLKNNSGIVITKKFIKE